jgi:hypothetical protein
MGQDADDHEIRIVEGVSRAETVSGPQPTTHTAERSGAVSHAMSAVRKLAVFAAFLSVLALSGAAFTQTKPARTDVGGDAPVNSILWVGNSFFYYNNSLHNQVSAVVRGGDPQARPRGVSVTISGSGIDWHDMESYFRPDGIGRYSFVGDNEIRFNKPGRQFDAVIMMDCSQCPVHPQLGKVFHEYAKKHSDTVKKHGVRPVLFMSWAYKDKPEMTAQLAEQYTIAGNANDALVIPAGLAFAKAVERRPALELYQPDKRHPSPAGTYLAAVTTYAAIWRKSPVGNTYTAGLDRETAAFLQTVAWDIVREYYGR